MLNLRNKWQFKEEALLQLEGGYVDHQLHCPTVQVMVRLSLKFTWGNQALKSGEQRLHILHNLLRASKHPQNSLSDFFSLLFESVFWKQLNASCTESKSLIWLWIFMVLSFSLRQRFLSFFKGARHVNFNKYVVCVSPWSWECSNLKTSQHCIQTWMFGLMNWVWGLTL